MRPGLLQKALQRDHEGAIQALIDSCAQPVSIQDGNRRPLLSNRPQAGAPPTDPAFPIQAGDEIVGWASGSALAGQIAEALELLLEGELQKRSLADEILFLYREINLLFNLAEKLAAYQQPAHVARMALEEACYLVQAAAGALLVLTQGGTALTTLAALGEPWSSQTGVEAGNGLVGRVLAKQAAEVVIDVAADSRCSPVESGAAALICVPLVARNQAIGVIILSNPQPGEFAPGSLRFLTALAAQAGPAIESALFYEKAMREAQEREAALQKQIAALRIDLDEARQQKQVAEITETDYFRSLSQQAGVLRQIMEE